jgi:MerR family copper efflux transcriptional regulator
MIFIGKASALSGASVKAIRHYDKLGILPSLGRAGAYRVFTEREINLIKLIKQAQGVGFKLGELKTLFLSNESSIAWEQIDKRIQLKYAQITKEISLLNDKRSQLKEYSKSIRDCLIQDPNCPKPLV